MTRVIVCCGAGGVGKTTTAAALAVSLARGGRRVAVLTIDPARRLADALSVGEIGNSAVPVPVAGLPAGASLDAMMLDAQQTFDGIIARFAPSPAARDRILANHYYRFVSGRLAGVHEYMAMEKLYELASADRYDAIVLDTPPTAHALDFLAAPGRMSGLMDEGVLRWLVLPASAGGWRMIEMGSEVLAKVLQRMLGDRTIADIAEFFTAFQGLWEGFRDRSVRVQQMLREPATRFVLVATPAPQSRAEALQFLTVLADRRMPFSGFIVNRCATPAATPEAWPAPPAGVTGDWPALVGALEGLVRAHGTVVAEQEAAIARMQAEAPAGTRVWRLPELPGAVHDLAGLHALEPWLPTLDAVFA